MAYLAEEVHPSSIGLAMGLAIGGNGLGGMLGRLATALITDLSSWRYAMAAIAVFGFMATLIFWKTLPPSRHFVPRSPHPREMLRTFASQLRDSRLLPLYALGFLLMGGFVTTYNYVSYHLLDPPYSLSHTAVGFVFVIYLIGIFASAFIGGRADRVGRGRMVRGMTLLMLVGVALMATRPLVLVIAGICALTFGFFGGHSVASSWIGLRATTAKAQASALYLFFYYMGASVAGGFGGVVWDHGRWIGVSWFLALVLGAALVVTGTLGGRARSS
jgi:YNFM family putative membrane transporter